LGHWDLESRRELSLAQGWRFDPAIAKALHIELGGVQAELPQDEVGPFPRDSHPGRLGGLDDVLQKSGVGDDQGSQQLI
jgi:hypothetical protein